MTATARRPRRSCLRSPVGGAVIERTAVVGQMLDPAAPAFRIGNLSTLWLTVHAFERDAVRIEQGVAARLSFPALPGQDFGHGRRWSGGRSSASRAPCRCGSTCRNTANLLRPGMSATATLPVGETGAANPHGARRRGAARPQRVVRVPAQGRQHFEIRRIGRGRDLGGEVEVLSGLRAGETIVVDGAFLLKAQAEKGEGGHDEH